MQRSRRATIRDVAAHAGVSTAAVSKVIRNAYGVSDAMRERVEAAVEALDFRPLASARALRGSTATIGVMVNDVTNPYLALILDAMRVPLAAAGFTMFISATGLDRASQERTLGLLVDQQVAGIILIAPRDMHAQFERVSREIPLVVIARHGEYETFDVVAGDDRLGASLVMDHLVRLGHREIAFVGQIDAEMDAGTPHAVRRGGYLAAAKRHGLAADIVEAEWSNAGGRAAGEQLLRRETLPTAVFAGADIAAFGLLDVLQRAGVPAGQVSVVGYDDTPVAALEAISLTTVDQAGAEVGAVAVQLLLERLEGRTEAVTRILEPTLVPRRSTSRRVSVVE
ncbi:LacI family transcriptional regulator [Plantibacter flavus]|uniref:LacI family DNA-binding transcriptional regulator n=1 Tax=Plantibacter flavus TaxID=150123 RepID=UPI003F165D4C